MAHHILKCDSHFWDDVASGGKTFEVRFNDRGFKLGDTICLKCWDPDRQSYRHEITGEPEQVVHAGINYILFGGAEFVGLQRGYVVLGLRDVKTVRNHGPGTNCGCC